VDRDQGSKAVV